MNCLNSSLCLSLLLSLAMPCPAGKPKPPADPGWMQLFNGADLSGWKTHPDQPGKWHVKEGLLVGRGRLRLLFTERGDFENFHLRAVVRFSDHGSHYLGLRCPFALFPIPGNQFESFPRGYHVVLNDDGGEQPEVGRLEFPQWGENTRGVGVRIEPKTWYTVEVIAAGPRIVVKVNGKVTVDHRDKQWLFRKGHILLEQVDPDATIEFRKIEVTVLPPG